MKPSERIAEIARSSPIINETMSERAPYDGTYEADPRAIVAYLDEQNEKTSEPTLSDEEFNALVHKAVTALDDAREYERRKFIEKHNKHAAEADEQTRRIEVLTEQLKALTPRGVVLVETEGRVEVWFTGEVKPRSGPSEPIEFVMRDPMPEHDPEDPEATQPPASPATITSLWAVFENVERWRFKA